MCGGGRYDGLVAQLGGKPTPAVGFAMGIERLVLLLTSLEVLKIDHGLSDIYVTALGDSVAPYAMDVAESLRDSLPQLRILMHCGGGNMKKQLKRADKAGAALSLLIGEAEMQEQCVVIKPMHAQSEQLTVPLTQLALEIEKQISKEV